MHDDNNHRVSVRNCRKPFTRTYLMLTKRFRGLEPRPSQSSGLEVCRTRMAMVGRWIKAMIKNDRWAVTHSQVMEQKVEPIITGLPLKFTIECISYECLQSVCKNKYFITCMRVVYIGTSMFVKMYWFWILSLPPHLLIATGQCLVWI